MKIAIDAGHGLNTGGKRCLKAVDSKQTREWWLNDRIADRLQKELANYKDCEVLRVDDTTGRTDVSLEDRVAKANAWGADVYLSIHHNAGIGGKSGGGTMVFYYSSKEERRVQATALYNSVIKYTKLVGNRAEKVKKYGYYVLKNTKMPAFLIENGFMDSKTDTPIILTEAHANKTVQGLLEFLVTEYKLVKKQAAAATTSSFKVKVLASELNIRSGAGTKYKVVGTIKDKGTYTIVEVSGHWGKLRSGAGWISILDDYVKRV